jgi:hypothetical protein
MAARPAGYLVDRRYRLVSLRERTSGSEQWDAVDRRLDRRVAVRLFASSSSGLARCGPEMPALAVLDHPSLVHVFDGGSDDMLRAGAKDSRPYLVTEPVDGPTLRQRVAASGLSAQFATAAAQDLVGVLAYLRHQGIAQTLVAADAVHVCAASDWPGEGLNCDGTATVKLNTATLFEHPGSRGGEAREFAGAADALEQVLTDLLAGRGDPRVDFGELGQGWAQVVTALFDASPAAHPTVGQAFRHSRALNLATDQVEAHGDLLPWDPEVERESRSRRPARHRMRRHGDNRGRAKTLSDLPQAIAGRAPQVPLGEPA